MTGPTATGAGDGGVTLAAPEGPPATAGEAAPTGYELGEEIGRGGMGVVYRARDLGLDREVAVKLLQDRFAPDSGTAARFVEEARITGQLQHPGIPAVYHVGRRPDGRPFLAMKLIKGRTLDQLLKDQGASAAGWLGTFEGICHAVGYAHERGVIHRDLKPQNVMVGRFGEVQVMDWGLAKVLAYREPEQAGRLAKDETVAASEIRPARESDGSFTQAGSVLGTPAYMPPEQAAGELGKIDRRSDVFGLGAILCTMLTGKPPYEGDTADSIRIAAVRGKTEQAFARLDGCGAEPELVGLCKRCLAFEPADRPVNADAVAREVARLRTAADDRARRAELDRAKAEVQAAEQRKRRRAVVAAGGVVVAVLAVGVAGTGLGLFHADKARRDAETARQAEADERDRADKARIDAVAARDRADKARGEADAQRQKAQARLEKAVSAVETVITRVGTPTWAGRPELQAERRLILEEAIAFFQGLGEEEAKDPGVLRQLARAHLQLAAAYLSLAEYEKCGRSAQIAADLYAAFRGANPRDIVAWCGQIEASVLLGHIDSLRGHYAGALWWYTEAHNLAEAGLAANPAAADILIALAEVKTSLALHHHNTDPARAANYHAEALAIGNDLRAAHGADFRNTLVVYTALINLAVGETNTGRPDDLLAKFARARELETELERLPPPTARGVESFGLAKATRQVYEGTALRRAGKQAEGLALIADGLRRLDQLLAVRPTTFPLLIQKLQFLAVHADQLLRAGKVPEAEAVLADHDRIRAGLLKRVPEATWLKGLGVVQRSLLVVEYGRSGRADLVDRGEPAVVRDARSGSSALTVEYNLACAHALLAGHGPAAEREERAADAVRRLEKLLDTEYFRKPVNRANVEVDPDLDPLRGRADFQTFLARLRAEHPLPPPAAPPPRPKPEN